MGLKTKIDYVCFECDNIISVNMPKQICAGYYKTVKCPKCKFSFDIEISYYPLDKEGFRITSMVKEE